MDWHGGRARPVAVPAVTAVSSVAYRSGRLWVGGTRANRPVVVVSTDSGRTWRETPVPAAPEGDLVMVFVEVGPDGEPWLQMMAAGGALALWRHPLAAEPSAAWTPVRTDGLPGQAGPGVPIGNGMLAVSGTADSGLLGDGRYQKVDWPIVNRPFTVLRDGTLAASDGNAALLGVGRAADRSWLRIVLRPA